MIGSMVVDVDFLLDSERGAAVDVVVESYGDASGNGLRLGKMCLSLCCAVSSNEQQERLLGQCSLPYNLGRSKNKHVKA